MANRFKNPKLRECYDLAIKLHADPTSEFYYNGEPRRGAAHRCAFWDGYIGLERSASSIPGTMSWAFFRAGQDCRKGEA